MFLFLSSMPFFPPTVIFLNHHLVTWRYINKTELNWTCAPCCFHFCFHSGFFLSLLFASVCPLTPSVLSVLSFLYFVFTQWLFKVAAGHISPEQGWSAPNLTMLDQLFCSVWHTWLGLDLHSNPTLKSPPWGLFLSSSFILHRSNSKPATELILSCH